jgi:simple sugar transport system permease protein
MRTFLVRAGAPLAVGAIVLAVLVLAIIAGGFDLLRALSALWNGSFGSTYAFASATLVRATPLILVGLAVALAFRTGILNIGAEGQLLAGASAAIAVGLSGLTHTGALVVPLELIAGAVAGAMWASVAAILKRTFGVLEVISTLMLNFIAQYAVSYLVRGPLQEPTHVYPATASISATARLPLLFSGQRLNIGLLIALALAGLLWWTLRATAVGFRLRAVGAGAGAAASAGRVRVERVVFGAFLASGAIAGLGGAVLATGTTYALYEEISPGFGYSAIAVALLARLNPLAVIGTGVFFGALEAGATAMQRDAGVPSVFVAVIEALVILGVLAVDRARDVAAVRVAGAGSRP